MARNERDVELVIKARDEAERALTKITDALIGMSKAQDTVAKSARQSDGALSGLTDELAQLDTRLNALQDLGRVATALEKATSKISQMEVEAQQTRNALSQLGTEAQSSAARVAAAETKKAEKTKRTKEETEALKAELRSAKAEQSSIEKQINKVNGTLEAQTERLQRATKAYKDLQTAADSAGKALGVDPSRAGVQSAVAGNRRQRDEAQSQAEFRATAAQNDEIRKRAEYERFWAESLNVRETQQREASAAAAEAANAEARLVQQAERLKGQLNPLAAVQDRYNKELAEANMLMKAGKITSEEYAQAQMLIKGRMEASADAMGKMSQANIKGPLGLRPYELTNLSYQINDVVTGLMSGQPAVQILAQQGGQVFQIFARQLQGLLPRIAAMAPLILAAAGAAIVLGSGLKRAFDDEGNLRKFNSELARVASGTAYTAEGLQKSAREVRNLGVETAKTRDIFADFIKQGLNPEVFTEFTKTAKQFAKVTGQEIPEAAKAMAEGFSGGYEQVKKLDEQFDFLTAAEREHIRALFESGKAQDARRLAFDAFARRQDDAAKKSETVWTRAVKELSEAWRKFIDLVSSSILVQGLKALIDLLGEITLRVARFTVGVLDLTAKITDLLGFTKNASGNSGGLVATAPANGGRAAGGGAITKDGVVTKDIDMIVRTVIGEARAATAEGMQDVAAVILNRMERSGKSAKDIVLQKDQFEPWGNARTKSMLLGIKETDAIYRKTLAAIMPVLKGQIGDPTGGATLFYAPKAQEELGRNKPGFAIPKNRTMARDGHEFFTGAFVGDKGLRTSPTASGGANAITTETESARKRGRDAVIEATREYKKQLDLTGKLRIEEAGRLALEKARGDRLDEESAQRLKALAEEKERIEIQREGDARMREIRSEHASANREAGRQQDVLARQLADIEAQTKAAIDKRRAEAARNPAAAAELKRMEDELVANGEILKQRAQLEFREKEINALLEQRELALKRLKDQYDQSVTDGNSDPNKYLADVKGVLDQFNPRLAEMAASAKTFVEGIGSAVPPERTQKFVDQMNQIAGGSSAEQRAAQQAVLNNAEKAYNDILDARNAKLADLQQKLEATNPQEYLKQSRAVIEEFAPKINEAVAAAIALAEKIGGAKPSPELMAFISKGLLVAGDSGAQVNANEKAQLAAADARINEQLALRAAKLAEINALLEAGRINQSQATAQQVAAYQLTAPLIQKELEQKRLILDNLLAAKLLSQAAYDAEIAKLGQLNTELTAVDQRVKATKESLEQAFSGSVMNAFDTFARGLADGKNAIQSLGDAMRQFAADFLRQIAQMIMQQIIFNALQAMGGGPSPSGGSGGIFQMMASAISGGGRTSAGVKHTGGMVGSGNTRSVSAAYFANAVRYHSGGIAGLRPDEVPTILQRNEEVLTRDDPRHRMNGGMAGGGSQPVTVINTFDPAEFISKALGVPEGEKAILNFMRVNSRAVKSALG